MSSVDILSLQRLAAGLALVSTVLLAGSETARAQTLEELAVIAMEIGEDDLAQRALERGANPNGLVGGETLLAHAIRNARHGVVSMLVRRGADVEQPIDDRGRSVTPLGLTLERGGDFEMTLTLLRLGADPRVSDSELARTAIRLGHIDLFEAYLSAGGSPADPGPDGTTMFHHAVRAAASALEQSLSACEGSERAYEPFATMVAIAIAEGADASAPMEAGSLLSFALAHGMFDLASALLDTGASATLADAAGLRPIQVARDYALPEPETCQPKSSEPRDRLRARVSEAKDLMSGRLLRSMLQAQ